MSLKRRGNIYPTCYLKGVFFKVFVILSFVYNSIFFSLSCSFPHSFSRFDWFSRFSSPCYSFHVHVLFYVFLFVFFLFLLLLFFFSSSSVQFSHCFFSLLSISLVCNCVQLFRLLPPPPPPPVFLLVSSSFTVFPLLSFHRLLWPWSLVISTK